MDVSSPSTNSWEMEGFGLSTRDLVFWLTCLPQLLLEAGAPAYPQNFDKDTPADLATQAGYKAIVTLLGKSPDIVLCCLETCLKYKDFAAAQQEGISTNL